MKELLLEEYKQAKDKIRRNEERRYQMLVLNITGYVAVFSLSDKIIPQAIPIALLVLLFICELMNRIQLSRQKLTTAFVIEKFEMKYKSLNYEYGLVAVSKMSTGNELFKDKLMGLFFTTTPPFLILWVLSITGSFYFSFSFVKELLESSNYYILCPYIGTIVLGHVLVLNGIISRRNIKLNTYRELWSEFLTNEVSTEKIN